MPGPAVLVGPGAIMAAKHVAHVAIQYLSTVDVATVGSASLTAVLVYWCFNNLPDWIKKDISFRNLLKSKNGDISREEIAGLSCVVRKIQELVGSIQELEHISASADIPQLPAALLAFVQVSGQLKLQQIEATKKQQGCDIEEKKIDNPAQQLPNMTLRDAMYHSAGPEVPMSQVQSETHRKALTMATWAYYEDSKILTDKLLDIDYTLLRHHLVVKPGTVAHYIAVCPSERTVVVGLRGTSSLEDLLTDCMGQAVALDNEDTSMELRVEVKAQKEHEIIDTEEEEIIEIVSGHERIVLEHFEDGDDDGIRCHEGILISAKAVMDEVGPFLRDYLMECNYNVQLVGHSLGAGCAVVAASLLRSWYPELFVGDDHHKRIHAYAFAPPPVLDHDSAIAASSFCTTFVYNADLVSRMNISNLVVSLVTLQKIQNKLIEHNMNPTNPKMTVNFVNKLREGLKGSSLLTVSEFHETIRQAHMDLALRRKEHLFLPGKVFLVYNPWVINEDDESLKYSKEEGWKCVETAGTSAVFQSLEIDGLRCFTDHLTSSYFKALGMEYKY